MRMWLNTIAGVALLFSGAVVAGCPESNTDTNAASNEAGTNTNSGSSGAPPNGGQKPSNSGAGNAATNPTNSPRDNRPPLEGWQD